MDKLFLKSFVSKLVIFFLILLEAKTSWYEFKTFPKLNKKSLNSSSLFLFFFSEVKVSSGFLVNISFKG